jgi:hypothetical protein
LTVAAPPPVSEIETPQFCPWCGSPSGYRREARMPLWERLAAEQGRQAPQVLEETLHTEGYVTGCPGCRRVSHVIGHPPPTGAEQP